MVILLSYNYEVFTWCLCPSSFQFPLLVLYWFTLFLSRFPYWCKLYWYKFTLVAVLDRDCVVPENIHTLPMEGFFLVWIPHPTGNSSLDSYIPLKILAFKIPLPLRISHVPLSWWYGCFLEPHVDACMKTSMGFNVNVHQCHVSSSVMYPHVHFNFIYLFTTHTYSYKWKQKKEIHKNSVKEKKLKRKHGAYEYWTSLILEYRSC